MQAQALGSSPAHDLITICVSHPANIFVKYFITCRLHKTLVCEPATGANSEGRGAALFQLLSHDEQCHHMVPCGRRAAKKYPEKNSTVQPLNKMARDSSDESRKSHLKRSRYTAVCLQEEPSASTFPQGFSTLEFASQRSRIQSRHPTNNRHQVPLKAKRRSLWIAQGSKYSTSNSESQVVFVFPVERCRR